MKHLIYKLTAAMLALLCGLWLTACHDDEPDPTLSVDKTQVTFSAGGGTQEITVTSNRKWSVSPGDGNWLTINKTSDTKLSLKADKNETTQELTTTVTVRTEEGELSQTIEVKIGAAAPIFELSGVDAPFGQNDAGITFAQELQITCNSTWNVTQKPDWLSVSNMNGDGTKTIKVYPTTANTGAKRTGTLTISSGSESKSKEIIQLGYTDNCYAMAKDVMALCQDITYAYDFGEGMHHCFFTLMYEYEATNQTDAQIISYLNENGDYAQENGWVMRTAAQFRDYGNIFSFYGLAPGTSWYIVSVAYDNQNKPGMVHRLAVRTPGTDLTSSPFVRADLMDIELGMSNSQLVYKISMKHDDLYNAYRKPYYSYAVASQQKYRYWVDPDGDDGVPPSMVAYLMRKEIQKNPNPHDVVLNGSTNRNVIRERIEGPFTGDASYLLEANALDQYFQVYNLCQTGNNQYSGKLTICTIVLTESSVGRAPNKQVKLRTIPMKLQGSQKERRVYQLNPSKKSAKPLRIR